MNTFQLKIKARTGWSDAIVSAIRSEAEAELYIKAGLKEMVINGKPALVQPRINPDYVMPEWWVKKYGEAWRGWTNADLMGEGYPAHDENGDPYELHHIGQLTDSPLAELTWKQHHEDGNFAILHTFDDYSDIGRAEFDKEKKAYWMARYKSISSQTKTENHTKSLLNLLSKIFFLFSLVFIASCDKENEWIISDNGLHVYTCDTINDVQYEWLGEIKYCVPHGKGTLVAKDDEGKTIFTKKCDAFWGVIDDNDVKILSSKKSFIIGVEKKDGTPSKFAVYLDNDTIRISNFKGGIAQDYLAMYDKEGESIYLGEVEDGIFEGEGKMYSNGKIVYEGDFSNGYYNGNGKLYKNGELIYDGHFKEGKYSGNGNLYDPEKKEMQHLSFEEGEINDASVDLLDILEKNKTTISSEAYETIKGKIVFYSNWRYVIYGIIGTFFIIVFGILSGISYNSKKSLYNKHKKFSKKQAFKWFFLGGIWGRHRFNLSSKWGGMIYLLLLGGLLVNNLKNILLFWNVPSVWDSLFVIDEFDLFIVALLIVLLAFDFMCWIPYRVYYVNKVYYRRDERELDILKGQQTEVEIFFKKLPSASRGKLDSIQRSLNEAQEIMSRGYKKKFILLRPFIGDGGLEHEQEKFQELKELSKKVERHSQQYKELSNELQQYLHESRKAAYRNLFLAKELIAFIKKRIKGHEQEVTVDEVIDIELRTLNLPSKLNINMDLTDGMDAFSQSIDKVFGNENGVVFGALDAIGELSERSRKRSEKEEQLAEISARIVDNISRTSQQMICVHGELLRMGELLSSLYMYNKAFVVTYSKLRDMFFGEKIGIIDFMFGRKKYKVAESPEFQQGLHTLMQICSNYNNINQSTVI